MNRVPFKGNWLNAVDAKGRVSLPAEFRKVIETRVAAARLAGLAVIGESTLHVRKHPFDSCLQLIDPSFDDDLRAMAEASEGAEATLAARFARGRSGAGVQLPMTYDSAGRMVLNATHRRLGGIGEHAFFVGADYVIEVWDPATAIDALADSDPELVEQLRFLLDDKGITL